MNEILFFAADSEPYGKTYGNWTVDWWRWVLSIPKANNPVLDEMGKHNNLDSDPNQKDDNVLFLAGKLADENRNVPNRTCTLSSKKSILFPVINCECNLLERPELRTPSDIIEQVKKDEDTIVKKECFVDGKSIPAQRVRSDPTIFELNMVKDNLFDNGKQGWSVYGRTIASADGYWVFLKPLPVGKHIISFNGSCEYGRLNSGAIYELEVH